MYKRKSDTFYEQSITTASDAEKIIKKEFPEGSIDHREFVFLICLSQSNKILNISKLAEGGLASCVIDVRIIFQTALLSNAAGIILFHNHPSGSLIVTGKQIGRAHV